MKIIINAEPDEMAYVLSLVMAARRRFEKGEQKFGYGWGFGDEGKRRFFIRQIEGGFSAAQITNG